ncbi:MAG TPA: peptidylprolyl isomerase [Steroidobacter sp.]|uniref:peptidylprolyl isomerase n=1 Tax=Steroidobacter sp. TaxID=1978227 RepID=UPI002EDB52E0
MPSVQAPEQRVAIVTAMGTITVGIDVAAAPVTADNFLKYVRCGLIGGTSFYRIAAPCNQAAEKNKINIIQGGLSEDLPPPFSPIEHEPTCRTGLRHRKGTLSMARRRLGSAAGSFFICLGDQPELDHGGRRHPDGQGFAAFGQVLDGMEVVRAIWMLAECDLMLRQPVPILSAALMM